MYTKQERDDDFGTLLSSDPDFFPLLEPANLAATQSTPNSLKNLVDTF